MMVLVNGFGGVVVDVVVVAVGTTINSKTLFVTSPKSDSMWKKSIFVLVRICNGIKPEVIDMDRKQ